MSAEAYTPTEDEVREAVAEWMWSRRMWREEAARADGAELDRFLAALSTPPADDVREEAERRWPVMVTGYTDSDGSRFEYESDENRALREAFIAGTTFEVRPRGTVTDAEVEAALAVLRSETPGKRSQFDCVRAALEAAREAE